MVSQRSNGSPIAAAKKAIRSTSAHFWVGERSRDIGDLARRPSESVWIPVRCQRIHGDIDQCPLDQFVDHEVRLLPFDNGRVKFVLPDVGDVVKMLRKEWHQRAGE